MNYIMDDGDPRKYFHQLPNLVDDLGLDPYEYRLYGHMMRIIGREGACWKGSPAIAEQCGMSLGKVSQVKRQLAERGLIRVERRNTDNGEADWITVVDIWVYNMQVYSAPADQRPEAIEAIRRNLAAAASPYPVHRANTPLSPHESPLSPHESPLSPHETKNIESKEDSIEESMAASATPPTALPPAIAVRSGESPKQTQKPYVRPAPTPIQYKTPLPPAPTVRDPDAKPEPHVMTELESLIVGTKRRYIKGARRNDTYDLLSEPVGFKVEGEQPMTWESPEVLWNSDPLFKKHVNAVITRFMADDKPKQVSRLINTIRHYDYFNGWYFVKNDPGKFFPPDEEPPKQKAIVIY